MSGDGTEFEYPDTAGYPDGMGTLHEGTQDENDENDEAAEATADDLDTFAMSDEEDVEGV
ncbi:hypothetical protein ACFVTX_13035 [Agromyces sp. NPDC058136]|uniref:hypothetical protein n=1 Tax=Agromyces sp. NPDC058136 TaxID=3346354 RepID=UPI0036DEC7BA